MKKILASLFCVSVALPVSGMFAQNDAPTIPRPPRLPVSSDNAAPSHLDGNYVLTLTSTEKDQPGRELSVVVATPTFSTSSVQPIVTFSGKMFPQEGGVFQLDYQISGTVALPTTKGPANTFTNVEYRSITTVSSVLLHLGEPVQIIKDGDQTYTLKIDRSKPAAP